MSYNTLFTQALKDFDAGHLDETEHCLRQILETAPSQPDTLNLLGLVAQTKGLHNEAVSCFSAAIREKNTETAFYYNLAFSLKALHQYADAILNFNKALQLMPQLKEAHNEIACIYETLNQLETARMHWQSALALDSGYTTAKINLANSYCQDNPLKAETELTKIAIETPSAPLVWYNLSYLFYNRNEFTRALSCAQRADTLTCSDDIKYLLGIIYKTQKDDTAAEKYFTEAETINPNHFHAKLELANIFSKNENFALAEPRYKRLLELDPKSFDTHQNYAEMLYRQHRLSEALEEYRQAVIIAPASAEVNNNLGVILKDLKEYEQALGLFFNALNHNPKLDAVSVNIAETLILLAKTDENKAREIAANWQKSYPDNSFAKHINAALQGDDIGNNKIYIEKLFDNFADNYEIVMQNLDYSAPLAVGRIARSLEGRIVDLGCGSGLVGLAVKTDRNQIIGVDLSASMLELATQKNIYAELVKADILDFLRERNDFNWILAADVLGYIGTLDEFIKLCKNKNIIFTIEELEEEKDYKIYSNGRFKHSPLYVEKLLRINGFSDIFKEKLVLRTENGIPVNGYIFKAIGNK